VANVLLSGMPDDKAELLRELARTSGTSMGAVVCALLTLAAERGWTVEKSVIVTERSHP